MAEETNLSPEKVEQAGVAKTSIIPEEGDFGVEQAVEKVAEGLKTADQIDETLTRVKEDRGQRQKQAAKQAQKKQTGAISGDEEQVQEPQKNNRYFARGLKMVSRLTRTDIKQATLLLRSLRQEFQEKHTRKRNKL